jgi:putative transposase
MKKSRFTETQIVAILAEGESGIPVLEVCRKHGISSPTYYQWNSNQEKLMLESLFINCLPKW